MATIIDAVLNLKDQFTPVLKNAETALQSVKTASSSFGDSVRNTFTGATATVGEHDKIHKRLQKTVKDTGKAFTDLGAGALIGTAALMSAAQAAVTVNQTLDKNIAQINALNGMQGLSREEMDNTRQTIYKMSRQLAIMPDEMSAAFVAARKNGIDLENIQTHVTAATRIAKVSGIEQAESVKQLAQETKAYYLTQQDQINLQDQLVAMQTISKHSIEELQPALAALSGKASNAGVSFVDLGTQIGYMTNNLHATVPQAQASMEAFFASISGGSPKAIKAAQEYGIDLAQAQEQIKQIGMPEYLRQMAIATGGNESALKKITGSVEMAHLAMSLMTSDGMSNFKDMQNQVSNSAGFMDTYLKRLGDTDAAKFKKAMVDVKTTMAEAFAGITPFLTRTAEGITYLVSKWNGLDSTTRGTILEIAKDAVLMMIGFKIAGAVIGNVIGTFEKFSAAKKHLDTIIKGVQGLQKVLSGSSIVSNIFSVLTKGFTMVKSLIPSALRIAGAAVNVFKSGIVTAFRAIGMAARILLANPIGLAISAIVVVLYLLITHWDTVKEVLSACWESISNVFSEKAEYWNNVLNGVLDFINNTFVAGWSAGCDAIRDIFTNAFNAIEGVCNSIMDSIKSAINTVIGGINNISVDVPEWVPGVGGSHYAPNIPMLANGTNNWNGGLAMVHDKGAEIIDLPQGSRVYPHDKSLQMARNEGHGNITISIPKLADQIIVHDQNDIDAIADQLVFKIKSYSINRMAGAAI